MHTPSKSPKFRTIDSNNYYITTSMSRGNICTVKNFLSLDLQILIFNYSSK